MIQQQLSQRDYLLSLWAQDRLSERATVTWAVGALKKIRGSIGNESVALFEFLESHARKAEMPSRMQLVWHLFKVSAKDAVYREDFHFLYGLRDKINERRVQLDDLDQLVSLLRPRLKAKELSVWAEAREASNEDPIGWVHWEFEAALHSSNLRSARLTRSDLASLSVEMLHRILDVGTVALKDTLAIAQKLDWLSENRDLPNLFVHRVFIPEVKQTGDDGDDDTKDADEYNRSFVPIVRLLSESFEALAKKDLHAAKAVSDNWIYQYGGIFNRLAAFSMWEPSIQSGASVGKFLFELKDNAFWLRLSYPEIATLRALRWGDVPNEFQEWLRQRLLGGPPARDDDEEQSLSELEINYGRDYEIARIVDSNPSAPDDLKKLVAERRAVDPGFPKVVPAVEVGLPGVEVSWVPDGSPDEFKDVPKGQLLARLAQSKRQFGEGDNAEAFAQTIEGKLRIVEELEDGTTVDEAAVAKAWHLLLSYGHTKDDDPQKDKHIIERIAKLADVLSPFNFAELTARLCYWVDAADERAPRFAGSTELWLALLPGAARIANMQSSPDDTKANIDLTTAALNEPLGHLLSVFMRRCPAIPRKGERPPLDTILIEGLKALDGRAKELLANRMAIQMNYFFLADKDWLNELVLNPMKGDGEESDRLWEAFAKYSRAPSPPIWQQLQHSAFRRLSSTALSPEAKRRLAEIVVMIWIWSRNSKVGYKVDTARMRTAIGLAKEDVRGAVAWQFSTMIRSPHETKSDDDDELIPWPHFGQAFFEEVWPLESDLQSAQSANDFARVPARVGPRYFEEAFKCVLPYLTHFEVWSVNSDFGLDPNENATILLLKSFPVHVLTLLAACINANQSHGVYELGDVLDQIVAAKPDLRSDNRMRHLRKFAASL
ncbi:hypothetical protein [Bradyrhizobium sp. AUGA SZCCT0182]|uniref:hypothetical protein n=1 Tax=Bradyrhizobium sp. AUGA SZCCT0182 TaxID=2807667 RepID=UPI001BA8730D|nr:hypothetical protein [Bradyrhizobium sp. AUGA SZCCT0182]MBR1234119.1 hypothetical protein [Bradyrhizobium sp. AUGA SZCCT0182]